MSWAMKALAENGSHNQEGGNMKKMQAKTKERSPITPAVQKQIQALSRKKDVGEGLKWILSDYQKYRKAKDKVEAILKVKGA